MLSVAQALDLVLSRAAPLPPTRVNLREAQGCVLAEPITSDIDSPPYDKSIVDGYALVAADAGNELQILEEITAGMLPTKAVVPGTATRIMTGAPIPPGADAVVMVEQTETLAGRVRIRQPLVKSGQNIMPKASSLRAGQVVLEVGKPLRAIEIGLLAEVGCADVPIIPRPKLSVLVTGDELVESSAKPAAGQIRNSNGPLLAGLATAAGAHVRELGIARDEQGDLARSIDAGLGSDVLVISGGVSAGVLDLVPSVLESRGVRQVFHKVSLKPGKPLWFGVRDHATGRRTLVFGLPGNPVSSLVCFHLFVLPALQKMRGLPPTGLARREAKLAACHVQRGDRPTYWPSKLSDDESQVTPLAWKGSGDLCTLTSADCLAVLPAGDRQFTAGEKIDALLL